MNKRNIIILIAAAVLLVGCVFALLIWRGSGAPADAADTTTAAADAVDASGTAAGDGQTDGTGDTDATGETGGSTGETLAVSGGVGERDEGTGGTGSAGSSDSGSSTGSGSTGGSSGSSGESSGSGSAGSDNGATSTDGVLTYAEYIALSSAEQRAYYDSFATIEDFVAWFDAAKAEYNDDSDAIEITGPIDLEQLTGTQP